METNDEHPSDSSSTHPPNATAQAESSPLGVQALACPPEDSSAAAIPPENRPTATVPQNPSPPHSELRLPNSDELPALAGKLQDALERHHQATLSLFHQTFDLLGHHTRAFSELDHRLSDLASQIKSLKNR